MKKSLTIKVSSQADLIGMLAAIVCVIHCLVTPLFILAKPSLLTIEEMSVANPWSWWKTLDYLFLLIGLLAVLFATQASSPRWLVIGLWISWFCLVIGIYLEELLVGKFLLYGGALILVIHHAFHYKHCKAGHPWH